MRAPLHAVPLDRALLADAGGADHRPQPSLRRLRRHHRAVHRLSRATIPSSARRTPRSATILKQNGYATSWFGKNHNTPSFQYSTRRPVRPMAGRHGLRIFLRLHGRRDRPVDAVPLPQHDPDFPLGRQARLQPDHRHGGRGHRPHEAAQRGGARQAVLRLLRARRHPRAAPADAGVDRQVQGQVRHGLERDARPDLRQPEAAWRDPGEHAADAVAG